MRGKDITKEQKMKNKKVLLRDYLIMIAVIIIAAVILIIFQDKQGLVLSVSKNYLLELLMIFPAVLIVIGLFSVWVPNDIVVKYLGKTSGFKGTLLSIILGMFPTGPLYIAFPMAIALQRKGARISNIVIFLSTWACIKLPQELIEIQFLGIKFTLLRLSLTIFFIVIMGYIIEQIITRSKNRKKVAA